MDQHDRSKLDDPFFKLEDTKKKTELKVQHDERLAELKADSFVKYKDDYAMNKELRKRMRWVCAPLCVLLEVMPHGTVRTNTVEAVYASNARRTMQWSAMFWRYVAAQQASAVPVRHKRNAMLCQLD